MAETGKGLEGVVAAETSISDIQGRQGRLWYCGYDIADLAAEATFEEVVYLLHHSELPAPAQLEEITAHLAKEREPNEIVMDFLPELAEKCSPMSMLRTAISAASALDPDGWDNSEEANFRKAIRLTAVFPTLIAYYERMRKGKPLISPEPTLTQATNFLWMLTGEKPNEESTRIFDACLILHADHTMNASTFAARVCAATLSDIHSAVTAAISALKGPLHGGANEAVMEMLQEIEDPSKARAYVSKKLDNKEKIMGFGHRVYKTEDPRATVLRRMAQQLAERTGNPTNFEISREIEKTVMDSKGIYPNVDFYAASVYGYLGIPTDLFTCVFACSRVAGWTAHVREQYADNRLIRPDHEYVGPPPRPWLPLSQR